MLKPRNFAKGRLTDTPMRWIHLQAYRKLDDMATKQTETLRKLTKQVSGLLENTKQ